MTVSISLSVCPSISLLSMCPTTFNPPISIEAPGDGLLMRPLSLGDFHRGFLPLLSQLTTVGEVSQEQWQQRFNRMLSMKQRKEREREHFPMKRIS